MSTLREIERDSIRKFLTSESGRFDGRRVLDYGCGAQPYRSLIEDAGGIYAGFDQLGFPGHVAGPLSTVGSIPTFDRERGEKIAYDVIVCTQVVQYVDPIILLRRIAEVTADGGILLMTGPTNWPVVEGADLHRFTVPGITAVIKKAGWRVQSVAARGYVQFEGESWPLGWWAVAERR